MKLLAPILAASLAICASAVRAEVTETTTTTTTVESAASPNFVLPAGVTYNVINPTTGTLIGPYAVGSSISAGNYIIDQSSGRVVATSDGSGRLIALSTMPSTLPAKFLIVNGQLVYFNDDYSFRRAQLEAKVTDEYAAGRLTNSQAKELREKLGYIANLQAKRKDNSTYSKSTIREIERKFADVNSMMAHDIADTNTRKAKIGLRVD